MRAIQRYETPIIVSPLASQTSPTQKCALHPHGYTEHFNSRAMFSTPSVPGLIMAVGNVGEQLAGHTDSGQRYIPESRRWVHLGGSPPLRVWRFRFHSHRGQQRRTYRSRPAGGSASSAHSRSGSSRSPPFRRIRAGGSSCSVSTDDLQTGLRFTSICRPSRARNVSWI